MIETAGTNPSPDLAKRVAYARKLLSKCHIAPKQVVSAMINVRSPNSWHVYPSQGLNSNVVGALLERLF